MALPDAEKLLDPARLPGPIEVPAMPPGDLEDILDLATTYRLCTADLEGLGDQVRSGGERVLGDWPSAQVPVRETLTALANWYDNARGAYQLIWTTLGRAAEDLADARERIAALRSDVDGLNAQRLQLIALAVEAGGSQFQIPVELQGETGAWLQDRMRVRDAVARVHHDAQDSAERTARDLTLARAMTKKWRRRIAEWEAEGGDGGPAENPIWGLMAPVTARALPSLTSAAEVTAAAGLGSALGPVLAGLATVATVLMLSGDEAHPNKLNESVNAAVAGDVRRPMVNTAGEEVEVAPQPAAAGGGAGKLPRDPCGPNTPEWLKNFTRGNAFDDVGGGNYDHNEVVTQDGKRLDSYKTTENGIDLPEDEREIVSRKYSQLASRPQGALDSLREIDEKYAPNTELSNGSAQRTGVPTLEGQKVLEVPPQAEGIPQKILDEAAARDIVVRDSNGMVYSTPADVSTATDPLKGFCE